MEILVRFITCCGINMRIYLYSEMPNGKKKKKNMKVSALFLFLPLYLIHFVNLIVLGGGGRGRQNTLCDSKFSKKFPCSHTNNTNFPV